MLTVFALIIGSGLIWITTWDMLATVLRPVGAGKFTEAINRKTWNVVRPIVGMWGGQALLLFDFAIWSGGIVLGFALVVFPFLSECNHFRLEGPEASFLTAMAFSAGSFLTLGFGDINPASNAMKYIASLDALLGALFFALVVSYLFQILEALNRLNRCETLVLVGCPRSPKRADRDALELQAAWERAIRSRSYAELVDWIERLREPLDQVRQDMTRYPILIYFCRRRKNGWIDVLLGHYVGAAQMFWTMLKPPEQGAGAQRDSPRGAPDRQEQLAYVVDDALLPLTDTVADTIVVVCQALDPDVASSMQTAVWNDTMVAPLPRLEAPMSVLGEKLRGKEQ